MMASGKNAKKNRKAVPVVSRKQGLPWLTIAAVAVILILAGGIFAVVLNQADENNAKAESLTAFRPSESNMDPSTQIQGIYAGADPVVKNGTLEYPDYKVAIHVSSTDRVAYNKFPPVGGPHDAVWAACNGVVYDTPVRNENMVHPLEHGAIWIAYNPATIAAGDLDKLKALVENKSYMVMSPYTDLTTPISLQAWAHQLQLDSASDPRIEQFVTALRTNQFVTPEYGASCDQQSFDKVNPPALDTSPIDTASAIPMDGGTLAPDTSEMPAEGSTAELPVDPSAGDSATTPETSGAADPTTEDTATSTAGSTAKSTESAPTS